jgi:hypothetical protein
MMTELMQEACHKENLLTLKLRQQNNKGQKFDLTELFQI